MKKSDLQKIIKEAIAEVKQETLNENPALMALGRAAATAAGAAAGEKLVDKYLEDDEDPNDEYSNKLNKEGKLSKILGGAALLAALLMGNAKLNNKIYDQSPKLKVLVQKLEKAKADGNEKLVDKIEDQIKFQKIRIDVNR